jgi:hypothetical protein
MANSTRPKEESKEIEQVILQIAASIKEAEGLLNKAEKHFRIAVSQIDLELLTAFTTGGETGINFEVINISTKYEESHIQKLHFTLNPGDPRLNSEELDVAYNPGLVEALKNICWAVVYANGAPNYQVKEAVATIRFSTEKKTSGGFEYILYGAVLKETQKYHEVKITLVTTKK